MNIGFISCALLIIVFGVIGSVFGVLKERAAILVSGFNSLSKEEQNKYDKASISRDMRNQCFIWTLVMVIGAIFSWVLSPYMAIPAYLIWLVLFFKDVHFDAKKAFEISIKITDKKITNKKLQESFKVSCNF